MIHSLQRTAVRSFSLLAAACASLSAANAALITIQPQTEAESKDTKIYVSVPTSNFSSNLNTVSSDITEFQGLVQFDLSPLATVSANEIGMASIRLYVTGLNTNAQSAQPTSVVTLSPILSDWRETAASAGTAPLATWAAFYGTTPTVTAGAVVASQTVSGVGFYDFDITALAQSWVAGTSPNFGVLIKAPGPLGDVGIADVDAAGAGFGPALVVQTVPEPSTLCGLLAAGFLALQRKRRTAASH